MAFAVISLGGNFNIVSPKGYEFDKKTSNFLSGINGGEINKYNNPEDPIINSDIVYTDVWTSMGQEDESKKRLIAFEGFQITKDLLDKSKKQVKFMHDLPAHPGEEIEDGLLYDSRSIVFDQSENRLWAQTALMDYIF